MNLQSETPTQGFRAVLPALILLTAVFFTNFLSRTVLGPLLLPIGQDLQVGLTESSSIFLSISAGFSLAVMGAGFVSAVLRHRRTIVLSISIIGTAMLGLSMAGSLPVFLGWSVLLGAGAGLYIPSSVATITTITQPARWGQAFSVHELGPNLAFILAPAIAQIFLHSLGHHALFALLGSCSLLLALVYARRGPYVERPGNRPMLGNVRTIIRLPAFRILVVLFVLAVGVELGIYGIIPAFLVRERGISLDEANMILAGTRGVALLALPFTGRIIRRLGYRTSLGVFAAGAGLGTLLSGFGPLWWTAAMLTIQPMCIVCFFPVSFAVLALVCPKASSDLAASLTITCSSLLGMGLIPGTLTWLGETWNFALAFGLYGAIMTGCSLLGWSRLHLPEQA